MTILPSLHIYIEKATRLFALAGGAMLILLALLTIISVIGRTINAYGLGPIQGDFELVENGTAFVVFCCLPYCQIHFGHVSVDILARSFPTWLSYLINVISQVGMMVIALIITRQLYFGMMDKYQWGETSFILQLPLWWGYAASFIPSLFWVCTALTASFITIMNPHNKGTSL